MRNKKRILLILLSFIICIAFFNFRHVIYYNWSALSFTKITPNEINVIKENPKSLVYVGRSDCIDCQIFIPTLKKIAKKEAITVYYLDTNKKQDNALLEELNIDYVPSLIINENGKIKTIDGQLYQRPEDLKTLLKTLR